MGQVTLHLALHLLDGACTLYEVQNGLAVEANPLVAPVLHATPMGFMALKAVVPGLCALFLSVYAPKALKVLNLVYGALALYHIGGIYYATM